MSEAAVVVGIFALVLVGGLVLRQWSRRQVAELEAQDEQDLADLADPSRWPAPPPNNNEDDAPGPPSVS